MLTSAAATVSANAFAFPPMGPRDSQTHTRIGYRTATDTAKATSSTIQAAIPFHFPHFTATYMGRKMLSTLSNNVSPSRARNNQPENK